jgi:hypothetical protein
MQRRPVLLFTVFVYSHSFRQAPLLGLAAAPFLALVGAVVGALPISIACGPPAGSFGSMDDSTSPARAMISRQSRKGLPTTLGNDPVVGTPLERAIVLELAQ